ncbi:hypothetical protein [Muribaculum intestinale]|uniref:hypothetical protein n=1 Tax=Muribaculum intestinale TaxID=1796646 RepID=UPI003F671AE2
MLLSRTIQQINDFVRKVIETGEKRIWMPAAPYSFRLEPVKDGRKIIAFKFTPLHYPQRGKRGCRSA